jgi:hypothetical protein
LESGAQAIEVLGDGGSGYGEERTIMLLRLVTLLCIACLIKGPAMATPPPSNIAKTVTFIFLADDKGDPRIQNDVPFANGTGFFVLVENENGPGGYGYLVTAKHVLKDEHGEYFKRGLHSA